MRVEQPTNHADSFYDAAYTRILRTTAILGVLATTAATIFFNWRSGAGAAIGSLAGYLNFRWLHRGTDLMVERMLKQSSRGSKWKLWLVFVGRYALVIVCIYAIFKGSTLVFYSFLVALSFPILAAIGEALYEAFAAAPSNQLSN
jgi:hypothetical protein